ncbi:hypothetical protein ACTI_01150 [Actinoplanes sp. OR16]|uniref:hypothetical protein n=1 Tax=Actinoplanes sp. OR16 TaxID=946334 RepID=UPI000F70163B|nr:hypothetical protein [Actinoplanes sp. OR16]BBH63430.1 hypothetical protein ACTI_01150 [Actinoplanes sp. OR16]
MSRFSLRTAVLSLGLAGVTMTAGQALAAPLADPPPANPAPADAAPVNPAPAAVAPPAKPQPAAGKPKPPKKPAGPAQAIALVRTGGIAGAGPSVYTLVGSGGGNDHNTRTLRLASSREFMALRSSYVPKDTCCDRFEYTIEVGYRNGGKKKIEALEGTPGNPKVLLDVIHMMETMPTPKPIVFPPGFPFN